jgi:hypothetical protein
VLFDANTVESVLLASAVIVCLSGMMFQSGYLSTSADAEAAASGMESTSGTAGSSLGVEILVVGMILFTLVYWAIVAALDMANSAQLCTSLTRRLNARMTARARGKTLSARDAATTKPEDGVSMAADLSHNPAFAKTGEKRSVEELADQLTNALDRIAELSAENERLRATKGNANAGKRRVVRKAQFASQRVGDELGGDHLMSNPLVAGGAAASSDAALPETIRARRQEEAALGIQTLGDTDVFGNALADGWVRKSMGDTVWYEHELAEEKSWQPVLR